MPGRVVTDHQHNALDIINFDTMPPSPIDPGDVTGPFLSQTVTLTNAQIKSLGSGVVIDVVPAQGEGTVVVPVTSFISVDAVAGEYTGINETATIQMTYDGGSDASALVAENSGGGVSSLLGLDGERTFAIIGTRATSPTSGGQVSSAVYDASEGENLALGISGWNGGDGDFTGGNAANTLKVTIFYAVMNL